MDVYHRMLREIQAPIRRPNARSGRRDGDSPVRVSCLARPAWSGGDPSRKSVSEGDFLSVGLLSGAG